MNTKPNLIALSAALALGLGVALSSAAVASHDRDGSRSDDPLTIIGLTKDRRLIQFTDDRPGAARSIGFLRGLSGDNRLIGIDYRVQDKRLYGVGNQGGVYVIDATSAAVTKVSQLTVALDGFSFGVDFNPAADRLRIVSDTGQNLRHDVNPGGVTAVDVPLSYAPGMVAVGIGGAAYTNNDLSLNTGTTLYDIDFKLDQVVLQSPANAGTLAPTGKLGVNASYRVGFDIYSTVREGETVEIEGYASLQTAGGGSTRLYEITLFTGKATSSGAFAAENEVMDIAIPLNQR